MSDPTKQPPPTQLYLLVDGLLLPDAIKLLYRRDEGLEIHPIYLGTRCAALTDTGPILVKAGHRLIDDWHQDPAWQACSYMLSSRAPMLEVAEHLRRLITPSNYLGVTSILRFADPLTAYYWYGSYEPAHLPSVLGPIEQVWVVIPRQAWQPKGNPFIATFAAQAPAPEWRPEFALLGPAQIRDLDHAFVFRFKKRLFPWLARQAPTAFANNTPEQIDTWLQHTLQSGLDWGLVSEVALVTWADYCLALGADFSVAPAGAYQKWLAQNPEQHKRSADQRLDAFDLYREQTLAKETAHE